MNGRLCRIHVPSTYPPSVTDEESDYRTALSVLPFTLPDGMIASFDICSSDEANSNKKKKKNSNTAKTNDIELLMNQGNGDVASKLFMLHKIKVVHRMRGEIITDHCWSIVQNKSFTNNEDDDVVDIDNASVLVLAVLTRMGDKTTRELYESRHDDDNDDNDDNDDRHLARDILFLCSFSVSSLVYLCFPSSAAVAKTHILDIFMLAFFFLLFCLAFIVDSNLSLFPLFCSISARLPHHPDR